MNTVLEKNIEQQAQQKPTLSFWQIWNMSFGFLGLQYAFGLQQAFMSPIYRYLGVDEANLPLLWLAAPVTGLIIQPIIGAMSDRTWSQRFGRRRPYFLIGAVLSSICLLLMPHSKALWMAASLMWILDSSVNISMEPFRAFIADKLPESQRSVGFSVQTFFVGAGQILATSMATVLIWLGFEISEESTTLQQIPDYVKIPFYVGATVCIVAVLITVLTTKEDPPEDLEAFRKENEGKSVLMSGFVEIVEAIKTMPATMRQLWWVKFFTWAGVPMMFSYLGLSIARHVYDAPDQTFAGFSEGIKLGGLAITAMNVGCIIASFLLSFVAAKIGRRLTHAASLFIGGGGFISLLFVSTPEGVLSAMFFVGIAWASALTMPYVMLSSAVPKEKMGVYMGLFNTFIVIPMMISMVMTWFIYETVLGSDPRNALVLAGIFFIVAAFFNIRVDKRAEGTSAE